MRKQKTGLQKTIETIFQDTLLADDDHCEPIEHDRHDQDPLMVASPAETAPLDSGEADAYPTSDEPADGLEQELLDSDTAREEVDTEEQWLVEITPSTEWTPDPSGQEDPEQEESFFKLFLRLFTVEEPQ